MVQTVQRNAPVMIRFTSEEYEVVTRQAKVEGRSLANFVRSRLFLPEGGMIPATVAENAPHTANGESGNTRISGNDVEGTSAALDGHNNGKASARAE